MLKKARRLAGAGKRWLHPKAEVRAWREACRRAEETPRFTGGAIDLAGYRVEYKDLLTLCPQWEEIFIRETLQFRARNPKPRILDCGANVGLASLYFKKLYPAARITAYEADPEICTLLAKNLSVNGAADVEVVNAAVWTEEGSVDFLCEGGADSGSVSELPGSLPGPTRRVAAVRLKDVLSRGPLDLLKLDVEGAEERVLADCGKALESVEALILDLHEFDPGRRATGAVLGILRDAGFTFGLDDLNPLPWRLPVAGAETPFPGRALTWALTVRAWRA